MNNSNESKNINTANETRFRCRCSRSELLRGLEHISHAVMKKAPLPVLEGVLLCVENGTLSLTGYDLEFGVRSLVQATDAEGGAVVVQLKLFTDMLRSLTADELVLEEDTERTVVIRCGTAKCRLNSEPAKDFPVLPVVTGTQKFSLSAKQMVEMIHQTIFAVLNSNSSASESVLLDINHDELSLVACDGVRMAVQKESIRCEVKDSITIPTESLKKLQKLFSKVDGELTFLFDRRQNENVLISSDGLQVFFRLAGGNIIDYKRFLPSANQNSATVPVKDMLTVLKRCCLLKSKKKLHRVQLQIQNGEIAITCHGEEGDVEDTVPCEYTGEDIMIGFDVAQFLSIVKESRTDHITMVLYDEIHPVYFSPVGDEKRWFLLAPMRP